KPPVTPLPSPRLQHVDDPAGNHVAGLGGVGGHVRRGRVGPQRLGALPFLDHDKGVWPELRLKTADTFGVDRRTILNAALLGVDSRHIGAEFLKDRLAHASFGGDDGDNVDHLYSFAQAMRSKTLWCRLIVSGRIFVAQSP